MNKSAAAQLLLLALLWQTGGGVLRADTTTNKFPAEPFDYATPPVVTGTIFEPDTHHKKVLFTFERSATRNGMTVRVERRFKLPNGTIAATESIVYESGQVVSVDMKELQAGLWGNFQIKADPKKPARLKLTINHGREGDAKKAGTTDDLPKDTLEDDSIYPFILMHWNELNKGTAVKFRFVSLEWEKTFGFKLTKTGEGFVDRQQVIFMKMEPTNVLLNQFMTPILFTIEKGGTHRILEYIGRTTPRVKSGKAWKYLDADTVFDWQ